MADIYSEHDEFCDEQIELLKQKFLIPDKLQVGFMFYNTAGQALWGNKYTLDLLGYSVSEFKTLRYLDLFDEEYHKIAERAFSRFDCDKPVQSNKWKMKTKAGVSIYIRTDSRFVKLNRENYILTTFTDISEPSETEKRLKLSNRRLLGLVNNITHYLWTLDKQLCFVSANEAAIRVFKSSFDYDFTPGDFVMEMYQKRRHQEEDIWLRNYRAVIEKREPQYFEIAEIFYGRFLHISAELYPIQNKEGVYGISCLVRNDTDSYLKNQLNAALSVFKSRALNIRSVHDLLWAITDEVLSKLHLEDAIILMRKGDILQAKSAYGSKRAANKTIDSPFHVKVGQGLTGSIAISGKTEIINDVRKDDRYIELHFSAGSEIVVPIKIGTKVVGLINCESSYTNFFKNIHLEILEEVAQITAERIQQITSERKLIKANKELDRFVYSVSHDIRSPVSSVMGLNNLIEESNDLQEIKHYNQLINQSMTKMDRFIRNILDYSRNSRTNIFPERIELNNLLDKVLVDNSVNENYRDIEIKKNLKLTHVCSDRQRLKVVFNNLISNAIKYHDQGRKHKFVKVKVEGDGEDGICITVSDNGQGIKKEHLPYLFEMFYTANIRAQGSGIGLYILKETVDMLGGNVMVESRVGEGSKFIVKLPGLTERST